MVLYLDYLDSINRDGMQIDPLGQQVLTRWLSVVYQVSISDCHENTVPGFGASVLTSLVGVVLLRSEIPSGKRAKLRTVAASNNRDPPTRSLYYYLFAPHAYIFVLRAHPVRGESHNQRNTTGEVATVLSVDKCRCDVEVF